MFRMPVLPTDDFASLTKKIRQRTRLADRFNLQLHCAPVDDPEWTARVQADEVAVSMGDSTAHARHFSAATKLSATDNLHERCPKGYGDFVAIVSLDSKHKQDAKDQQGMWGWAVLLLLTALGIVVLGLSWFRAFAGAFVLVGYVMDDAPAAPVVHIPLLGVLLLAIAWFYA